MEVGVSTLEVAENLWDLEGLHVRRVVDAADDADMLAAWESRLYAVEVVAYDCRLSGVGVAEGVGEVLVARRDDVYPAGDFER